MNSTVYSVKCTLLYHNYPQTVLDEFINTKQVESEAVLIARLGTSLSAAGVGPRSRAEVLPVLKTARHLVNVCSVSFICRVRKTVPRIECLSPGFTQILMLVRIGRASGCSRCAQHR